MSGEEFMGLGKYHRGKVYDFLEEYSALRITTLDIVEKMTHFSLNIFKKSTSKSSI